MTAVFVALIAIGACVSHPSPVRNSLTVAMGKAGECAAPLDKDTLSEVKEIIKKAVSNDSHFLSLRRDVHYEVVDGIPADNEIGVYASEKKNVVFVVTYPGIFHIYCLSQIENGFEVIEDPIVVDVWMPDAREAAH